MTAARSDRADGGAGQFLPDLIAREGGSISFERFMQEALYHPDFGYYTRQVRTIGPGGDFSTSATLHGALGKAVAAWARQRAAELGLAKPWHLIELGGGSGQLAAGVLHSLGWWGRRGLRYHIVETSAPLREEQRTRLAQRGGIAWHDDIQSALRAAGGCALIISNEFVDAFPCVRLERNDHGGWHEVRVNWEPESRTFGELRQPWNAVGDVGPGISSVLESAVATSFPVGQRIEWHRSYWQWMQSWVPDWRRGALLTIDYGDELPALFHRRPAGTLRAYHGHRRVVGPELYARAGRQDLTADVNFTDLQRWGAALGLDNAACDSQAAFLRRWLPPRYLRRESLQPALPFLLDEQGAGGAFKVLEQVRRQIVPDQAAP